MTSRRVFHALDFDRTIFRTRTMEQKLIEALAYYRPGVEKELQKQSIEHGARGESFFVFTYLKERLGPIDFPVFFDAFHKAVPVDDLLRPGARERLAFAASKPGWSGGIMTFGAYEDQQLKLKLVELDAYPHLITNTPDKGFIIGGWKQADGTFHIPEELGAAVVDCVVLDDDKLRAFNDLPVGAYGVWLTADPAGSMQIGDDLKGRVFVACDLFGSIEILRNLLNS